VGESPRRVVKPFAFKNSRGRSAHEHWRNRETNFVNQIGAQHLIVQIRATLKNANVSRQVLHDVANITRDDLGIASIEERLSICSQIASV